MAVIAVVGTGCAGLTTGRCFAHLLDRSALLRRGFSYQGIGQG